MRKLRIAFLADGSFSHVRPYLEYFRAAGHEVFLIAYARLTQDFGVPTFDISGGADGFTWSSKWRYLLTRRPIRRVLREINADLLFGHYVTAAGVICLLSGFRPYALTVHGSDLIQSAASRIWRPIVKAAMGRAALVNTVSDTLSDLTVGMGVPPEKILVASVGVDTDRFAFREPSPIHSPPRILCTRILGELYDPMTIVRAAGRLRDQGSDFVLTFAAGGPLQRSLAEYVTDNGLRRHVRFLGGYANTDLPQLLREHDVYVSASRWDGTSVSLLEAMACGIPPVVSRIASNTAWLRDGESALMFDCGSTDQLAAVLARAMADDEWRRSAAAANRAVAVERADRNKNMRRLENGLVQAVEMLKG